MKNELGWSELLQFVKKYFEIPQSFLDKIFTDHPETKDRLRAIQDRYAGFWPSLAPYNQVNRLPETHYQRYAKLHEVLKPFVEKFGEKIKKGRDKKEAGGKERSDYILNSFFSSIGKCVHYALGGVKPSPGEERMEAENHEPPASVGNQRPERGRR